MIGFGINNKATFQKACQYANGAIIGTAFVKVIAEDKSKENIEKFMSEFAS